MNLTRLSKLLAGAKARTQIEQSQFAALKRTQEALVAEAASFDEAARAPLDASDALTGGDLAIYARRQGALQRAAKARLAAAEALEPDRKAKEDLLRGALRRELAWQALSHAAAAERRRDMGARDEERREANAQIARTIEQRTDRPAE